MRYFAICVFIYFIGQTNALAQSNYGTMDKYYPYKNEIGINFTNVLGNVLSLNPNNASSPYGLTYRRHMDNGSFRTGIGVQINNSAKDDFSGGSLIRRTLNEQFIQTRIGYEKHLLVNKRILFSYGLDALFSYGKDYSKIDDFGDFTGNPTTFISNEIKLGGGVGPMLRLEFKITDHIFVSSECSFYGNYEYGTETLQISGQPDDKTNTSRKSLVLLLPQSLFFNISF